MLMEQVLAVNDIDFDPSKVTDISELSAEEYLIYVRYEAEQCPAVVRAPIDSTKYEGCQTEYMPKMSDIPICPDIFLPSPEWVNDVVDKFSQFRLVSMINLNVFMACTKVIINLLIVFYFCSN